MGVHKTSRTIPDFTLVELTASKSKLRQLLNRPSIGGYYKLGLVLQRITLRFRAHSSVDVSRLLVKQLAKEFPANKPKYLIDCVRYAARLAQDWSQNEVRTLDAGGFPRRLLPDLLAYRSRSVELAADRSNNENCRIGKAIETQIRANLGKFKSGKQTAQGILNRLKQWRQEHRRYFRAGQWNQAVSGAHRRAHEALNVLEEVADTILQIRPDKETVEHIKSYRKYLMQMRRALQETRSITTHQQNTAKSKI